VYKKYITVVGVIFIVLALLSSPNLCIHAAKDGLLLWFNKVLPSLLPFIILINILSKLNIMQGIASVASPITQRLWKLPGISLFVFIMGFVAGYPMGAKIVRQLLDDDTLSASEAQKILCFSNNCGPLFIIGTVGTLILGNTSIGYFLLVVHLLAALLISIIFSFYTSTPMPKKQTNCLRTYASSFKFSVLINESVTNAMDTIVYIGGYIIFFSVIISIVNASPIMVYWFQPHLVSFIPTSISSSVIAGLFELSNGVNMLSGSNTLSICNLAIISFLIGFGGLCVHFQTSYVLGNCEFSLVPYIIAKLMQGTLSFILVYLFYPLAPMHTLQTSPTFETIWFVLLIFFLILFIYSVKLLRHLYRSKESRMLKIKYKYKRMGA